MKLWIIAALLIHGWNAMAATPEWARLVRIRYETKDLNGNRIGASGMLILPKNHSKQPLPLISYQHGTATARFEVPSRGPSWDGTYPFMNLVKKGYAVVAADYLGLGHCGGFHPFLHADSEASATLDLIKHVWDRQQSIGVKFQPKVVLMGYSQGAHSTLALLRAIESNQEKLPFQTRCTVGMSGPYDLSGTMRQALMESTERLTPTYAAYLVWSYYQTYRLKRPLNSIFQTKWAEKIPSLFDGGTSVVAMPSRLPKTLNHLFTPEFIHEISTGLTAENRPSEFVALMAQNDLIQVQSKSPVLLIAAEGDRNVPHQNSLVALEGMQNVGTPVEYLGLGPKFGHSTAEVPATQIAAEWLKTCAP